MRPRMNPSLSPPFHELDEYTFQNLCRDVFARQEGVTICEVYGVRGQKQRGIDLLARRRTGNGIEVGQCKCYKNFSATAIRKASDEFFKYLACWQPQGIKRFILFVACDLDRTPQQDEITKQTERFAQYGIMYEAWSASTLRLELSPYRDIVERHIPSPELVDNICGRVTPLFSEPVSTSSGWVETLELRSSQIGRLSSELSNAVAARFENIREAYREGRMCEAYTCLQALRQEASWEVLEKPLQGRILRTLALYTLTIDADLPTAREWADIARRSDPHGDDTIIRTFLTYRSEGAAAALLALGNPAGVDTVNIEIGLLLLELGQTDDALTKLATFPTGITPNAETRRLHALALLMKRSLVGAQAQIHMALAESPRWESVRIAAAMEVVASFANFPNIL